MLPELRSERRWRREMRKLCSNALKEEPRQALPVDHRDTRRRNPSDESKSDHIQISPQPISLKAFKPRNRTTKSSISKSNPKPITTHILSLTLILLTRWSFRRMNAPRRTDSSRRREAWRTLRRREKTPKSIKEEEEGENSCKWKAVTGDETGRSGGRRGEGGAPEADDGGGGSEGGRHFWEGLCGLGFGIGM